MGLWSYLYSKVVSRITRESEDNTFPLSDFQRMRHEIRPCDVILVEGRSKVADTIKTITQSRWSHAALYIGRLHDVEDPVVRQKIKQVYDGQPNEQLLVESQLGLGTVIRPLNTYQKRHMRICRPHELSFQDGQRVINFAVNRLGTEYDLRAIWDLARFYYPWGFLPKRWRSSLFEYQPGTATRTVCSTMISEAFASIDYPVLPLAKVVEDGRIKLFQRNPKLNTPSDFDYSPYFNIIKYPFMSFSTDGKDTRYRLMPWHEKGELSAEESMYYVDSDDKPESPELLPHRRSINEKENF